MALYNNILFTYDLTNMGATIAERAGEFAKVMNAKISMIAVIDPEPAYGFFVPTDIPSEEAVQKAEEKMKEVGAKLGVPVETYYVECGNVKSEILRVADEMKADLIVVGSHSIRGIGDLLGSTANAINNKAKVDVLTLKAK